ncbi:D-alanyl-D-alanine carboxypeptidase [Streptomyces sp. NPDC003077]|uniref:D-alanyl-D-alanine carboxypeptidase family protein n=1 Tax=Streptomyces sp. NPDC003077 TaxID=3154443 RepID=UPI0033A3B1F4
MKDISATGASAGTPDAARPESAAEGAAESGAKAGAEAAAEPGPGTAADPGSGAEARPATPGAEQDSAPGAEDEEGAGARTEGSLRQEQDSRAATGGTAAAAGAGARTEGSDAPAQGAGARSGPGSEARKEEAGMRVDPRVSATGAAARADEPGEPATRIPAKDGAATKDGAKADATPRAEAEARGRDATEPRPAAERDSTEPRSAVERDTTPDSGPTSKPGRAAKPDQAAKDTPAPKNTPAPAPATTRDRTLNLAPMTGRPGTPRPATTSKESAPDAPSRKSAEADTGKAAPEASPGKGSSSSPSWVRGKEAAPAAGSQDERSAEREPLTPAAQQKQRELTTQLRRPALPPQAAQPKRPEQPKESEHLKQPAQPEQQPKPEQQLKPPTPQPKQPADPSDSERTQSHPFPSPAPTGPAGAAAPTALGATTGPAAPTAPGMSEHTQQQPLPPMELLAQLTNTPAPPETPIRTLTRRLKIWTPVVFLLLVVLAVVQAVRPVPDPTLTSAGSTVQTTDVFTGAKPSLPWPSHGQAVVDIQGIGRMGSYGEDKPIPIGSVAKVMTSYLILKDHPLKPGEKGPTLVLDQKAEDDYVSGAKVGESVVEAKKGQRVSELEALEAVMLPSANNFARFLARWDSGTEEAFIKKMNATAKELGMTQTTYTDASGLEESTVSSAADQVKLAKAAMTDPVFRQLSKQLSYTSTTTSGGDDVETARVQKNFNKLVPLYGVVGIKTGSTTKAGGNLLFAAEKTVDGEKQLIIGAVFGQFKRNANIDAAMNGSRDLILAAGKELSARTVVRKGEVVGQVEDGLGGSTPVVATRDLKVIGWPGAKLDLHLTTGGKAVPHEAKSGTVVGSVSAGSGPGQVTVPVAVRTDFDGPSFGAKLTRLG